MYIDHILLYTVLLYTLLFTNRIWVWGRGLFMTAPYLYILLMLLFSYLCTSCSYPLCGPVCQQRKITILKKVLQRTRSAINWPKLAWCKDRWNFYTTYAVQLICTIFRFVYLHNVQITECTYYSTGLTKTSSQMYKYKIKRILCKAKVKFSCRVFFFF